MNDDKPNLIERMENLIHALGEAENAVYASAGNDDMRLARTAIDNASGIAGEILTMIDGR